MTTSTTAGAGQGTPGRRPPRSRGRWVPHSRRGRALSGVVLLAALLVLALGVDAAAVAGRLDRFPLRPHPGPGTTWVVVGLDSRAHLPAGASADEFGTAAQVPGARADVVLVVHRQAGRTTTLSVPRDLVVGSGQDVDRLALSWLDGPQHTVDVLCDIGIPTDHLVAVDLAGFAAVVDAAGGLDVDVPEPVRDRAAGLELRHGGRVHVDGATALALVRSRHPEHLVDGAWAPAPVDPDGRATAAGTVLSALAAAARPDPLHPWRLQAVAWAASGGLSVDEGTSATELAGLALRRPGPVTVLPVSEATGTLLPRFVTTGTRTALTDAGLSCHR